MDENDELLVIRVRAAAVWSGFNDRGKKWLSEHIPNL
jgi:hypothetical protein